MSIITSAYVTGKEDSLGNSQADADSKPMTGDSDAVMTSAKDNDDGPSQTEDSSKATLSGASAPDASVNLKEAYDLSSSGPSVNLGSAAASKEPCVSGIKGSTDKETALCKIQAHRLPQRRRRPKDLMHKTLVPQLLPLMSETP